MLVPDNCRVRKMGFSSASHLLRFHEWLWKRLASLIWLSMTLLFLWLWSFDRKLHVPLVRMKHAWFLWFLWNFYIILDAQMKVSDVHWFCVEVGSTLWFWLKHVENVLKHIKTYWNLVKLIESYQILLKLIKIYWNLWKPIKTYQNLFKLIKTC